MILGQSKGWRGTCAYPKVAGFNKRKGSLFALQRKVSCWKNRFSKFAELRPKRCILAWASGTHSVCVCAIHQNVKLLMKDARIRDLTADDDVPLTNYHTVLAYMICNPPLPACHLNECNECPGVSAIRDRLINKLDARMIESMTFKQWVSVDRCKLETQTKLVDDFVRRW